MPPRGMTPAPVADPATEVRLLGQRLDRVEDDVKGLEAYAHDNVHEIRNLFAEYAERETVTDLTRSVGDLQRQIARAEGAARLGMWLGPILTAVLSTAAMILVNVMLRR